MLLNSGNTFNVIRRYSVYQHIAYFSLKDYKWYRIRNSEFSKGLNYEDEIDDVIAWAYRPPVKDYEKLKEKSKILHGKD